MRQVLVRDPLDGMFLLKRGIEFLILYTPQGLLSHINLKKVFYRVRRNPTFRAEAATYKDNLVTKRFVANKLFLHPSQPNFSVSGIVILR
jgi:hypothetical protein